MHINSSLNVSHLCITKNPKNIAKEIDNTKMNFFWKNNLEYDLHYSSTPLCSWDRYADQNVREVWYQENSRRKRSTFGKTLLESSN